MKDFSGTSYHYPPARAEAVIDTLHGRAIADPYRWMENIEDAGARSWIDEQNSLTRRVLDRIPSRIAFEKRLAELLSIGTIGVPEVAGKRYFYEKRQGNENQPVLYWREGALGEPKALLDPNALSAEGIVAVDWWYPSRDGRLLAYGLSEGGSEQSTLHVLDVDTGKKLADTIARTRGSSVAWLPDGSGFYYMRFPNTGDVPKGEEHFHSRIRFHRLGDDPATDPVIFGEGRDMQDWLSCDLSDDGRFLVVHASQTARKTALFVKDLRRKDGEFVNVSGDIDAHFYGTVPDDSLYIQTNDGAPNYRLLKANAANPRRENWKEVIPEGKFKLEQAAFAGRRIFASYLENAASRLYEYDADGRLLREIALPGIGTVYGIGGEWRGSECFYGFTSFFVPQTVYRVDVRTDRIDVYDRVVSPVDPSRYEAEQVWCRSKDGTPVPMFVIRGKEAVLDGGSPAILYGYGGFDIPMTPGYSKTVIPWLEAGGIYAIANLRGGGEFGEEWHRAGMLEKKQNVFDDFHRRRRMALRREIHLAGAACHNGRIERRPPRRRGRDAAPRYLRGGRLRRAGPRHDALPFVLGRPLLDHRVRRSGQGGGVRIPHQVFAVPQRQGRRPVPRDPPHDGRERLAGRSRPRDEDDGPPADGDRFREPGASPLRDEGRARDRRPDPEGRRRIRGLPLVSVVAAGDGSEVTHRST